MKNWGPAAILVAALTIAGRPANPGAASIDQPSSEATDNPPAETSVAAGTPVTLMIKQPVSSRTAKRGDLFEIELASSITVGSVTILPAGTKGVAQVVHASPKGFGGSAGELIVAARYLEAEGRRVALRKTKFSSAGVDNAGAAIAASIASPVIGLFVTGTSVDLRVGSIIVAETAEPYSAAR